MLIIKKVIIPLHIECILNAGFQYSITHVLYFITLPDYIFGSYIWLFWRLQGGLSYVSILQSRLPQQRQKIF